MIKSIILILACLSICHLAFGQVDTAWVRQYDGPEHGIDLGYNLRLDSQGNIYIGGQTSDHTALLAYDQSGNLLWSRILSRMKPNGFDIIALNHLGDIFITGALYSTTYASLTSRYSITGDSIWTRSYEGPSERQDAPLGIAADEIGNVYVTGFTSPELNGNAIATLKYNRDGDTIWENLYYGIGLAAPYAMELDSRDNVIVTGLSNSNLVNTGINIVKYDSAGNQLWDARYDTSNTFDSMCPLFIDRDDNILIAACSYRGWAVSHFLALKYSSDGDLLWDVALSGPNGAGGVGYSISADSEGNVYATGTVSIVYNWRFVGAIFTVKINSNGDTCWTRTYYDPNNRSDSRNEAKRITIGRSGAVYVSGIYMGDQNSRYFIIKYLPNGDRAWVKNLYVPGLTYYHPYELVLDDDENIYFTGNSQGDIMTVKYIQNPEGVFDGRSTMPENFTLMSYPNPFNAQTTIRYSLAEPGPVTLTIYNLLGQKVATLVDGMQTAGEHKMVWDAGNQPSGVYFYRLNGDNFSKSSQMILLR